MSTLIDVDQPARQRAELLRAGADARVDGGALGAPASSRASRRMTSAAMPQRGATRLGREVARQRVAPSSTPGDVLGEPAEAHELLGEQRVHDAEEEVARRCPGRMK